VKTKAERAQFFSDLFTKSTFTALVRDWSAGVPGSFTLKDYRDRVMVQAVRLTLTFMARDGAFPAIPNTDGHDIWLARHWNALANGDEGLDKPSNPQLLAEALAHEWLFEPAYKARNAVRSGVLLEQAVAEFYPQLVDTVASGRRDPTVGDTMECSVSGERYRLAMEDWQPRLVRYDAEADRHIEIEPITPRPLQHVEIDFPSGRLIIADWLHLDELEAYRDSVETPSINNAAGVEEAVRLVAEQLGFLDIPIGNCVPRVLQTTAGDLVVGFVDDEQDDYADQAFDTGVVERGSICADRWSSVIIPRERLVELVVAGRKCGEAKANEIVDQVVSESGALEVDMLPGRKHLYYAGDHERFAGMFRTPDLRLPAAVEPYFVLACRPLELELEVQTPQPDSTRSFDEPEFC